MSDRANGSKGSGGADLWRGVDLSGITLMLGVGTGRLAQLLSDQIARAMGHLVALDFQTDRLQSLAEMDASDRLLRIRARPRQIPALADTVDLLVVNGVLREAPVSGMPTFFEELWRVLVPGGRIRIADVLEPPETAHSQAWRERNRIIRTLGKALGMPTALAVDLQTAAKAMSATGFEDLHVSLLPGVPLTDAWLEETVNAVRTMTSRMVDREQAHALLDTDLPRLISAYAKGDQRAAERFVLSGRKVGNLALDMEASFTEGDLLPEE